MNLRCCLPLAFALCCASAQTEEPHAIVDGKPVSLSDVQALMGSMPPQLQKNAEELFRYYGFLTRMAAKGAEDRLDQRSPYKEQLEIARKQVLAQAEINEFGNHIQISDADLKDYFEKHRDDFRIANIQSAFVPAKSKDQTPAAVKQAGKLATALQKKGAIPEQNSGGFQTMRQGDAKVPDALRVAVFQLKPGEVSAPVTQPGGVYVFRLNSISTPDFGAARSEVWRAMADARLLAWMDEVRKSVTVTH